MKGFQNANELIAESVLERHSLGWKPARHHEYLFVFDVDTFDRSDSFGEIKHLRFAKRWCREPTPVLLPDDRWIEAFFDRRPDAEAGRKNFIALVI